METIQEQQQLQEEQTQKEKDERLNRLLVTSMAISNPTESIGRRNVSAHRRVQSTALFSILDLDSPSNMRHRVRSLSLAEAPSLDKYYPGSHLLDSTNNLVDSSSGGNNPIYLSLWLLPPMPLRKQLSKDIAKLAMRYSTHGSSAPFMPHVTIVGSIACSTLREAHKLGEELQKKLKASGGVPCRFDNHRVCKAMYRDDDGGQNRLVWSQSCIAIMERSTEFLNLLDMCRQVLKLPSGEWMFPGPICEPHFSMFYGGQEILSHVDIEPPPNFVATEAALFLTTPGTLEGVAKWREITRISLLS